MWERFKCFCLLSLAQMIAEDRSKQWEGLIGSGKKKLRCSQCTRPGLSARLREAVLEAVASRSGSCKYVERPIQELLSGRISKVSVINRA